MCTTRLQTFRQVQNSDGVALPIALLSLVAVTILVTSVLLSSSTEVVLSSAHQDATRGLFNAEGAIEAYVAVQGAALAPTTTNYTPPGGSEVEMRVTRLASVRSADAAFRTDRSLDDITYAVSAVSRRGGRQIMALVKRVTHRFNVKIDAGLVSGDNVVVSGGAKLSDGSDSPLDTQGNAICADTAGGKAVQTTLDADTAKVSGSGTILGENQKIDVPAEDLVKNLFGRTLEEMIESADIKLDARKYKDMNVGKITSLGQQGRTPMQLDSLNWGCPGDIFLGCEMDMDISRLPTIAINAATTECTGSGNKKVCDTSAWGTAIVDMSHGQGILIVYNGNFKIAGQFAFKGIVLVQGSFTIEGKGSDDPQNSPKVEGAVIGLGLNKDGTQSTVSDNTASGNSTVRYNRCAIKLVTDNATKAVPDPRLDGRTFGWFEVVR